MKISFLVTYYQQEQFVRQSLDSILALEKPAEWELLIGDDGSTDGTLELLKSYRDRDPEHIRLYVMDREPGRKYVAVERASANRLNLVRHAAGDYYSLMDGDDFYSETDFIPQALAALDTHPDVSIVGLGTWMYQDGSPKTSKPGGLARPVRVHRKKYLRWQYTHAGACVIRNTHPPEELDMLTALKSFDDNDIVLSALARGRMMRINRPVYAYRQTQGSVYNAMPAAERAALNVCGLGIGLKIMGPAWKRDVTARFATAVWMAWFLRDTLPTAQAPEKYQAYLAGCRRAGFSEGEKLLSFPELKANDRNQVRKWVWSVGRESPPRILYAWLQVRKAGKNTR